MPPTTSYPPVTFGPDGKIHPLLVNGNHLDLPAGTTLNGASIDTGSVATWGDIIGTLSSQTDLQNALNAKQAIAGTLALAGFSSITGRIGNANLPLGAQLYDNAGTPLLSADFGARVLKGPTGNISMAWDDADYLEFPLGISTNYITASDTSDSIYVDLRSLHDTSGVTTIDWNTRHLLATDGSSVLVDWANPSALSLMDSTVAIDDAGNLSVAGIFIGDGSGITNIYGLTLAANQSVRRNAGNTAYEAFQAQPYSGGTLSIASGKTLTASNTLTLSGIDGSTLAIGTGGTLGSNAYTSTAYAPIASPTFTGTVTSPNFTLSGNQSAAAWTTSGLRLVGIAGTLTDTTSSGTVAAAYTNKLGGNTIAASSATTFTDYISSYFSEPVAGTNVTLTNKYALGADSLKVGTSNAFKVTSAGNITVAGTLTLPSASIADAALSANVPLLNAANVFTANNSNSYSGTASTPAMKWTGTPFAGTSTTSFPLVYINAATATASTTLNTSGTSFGINAHSGIGNLFDFMLDGVSKASLTSAGAITLASTIDCGSIRSTGNVRVGSGGEFFFDTRSTISSPADGKIAFQNNADAGTAGILGGRVVTAKTTNYSVAVLDSNTFFTNAGASGTVNFTLPTAAAGITYTFYVDAAQSLTITAGASTTIQLAGSTSASAGNITSNTVGNCVTLVAISSTRWVTQNFTGTWTVN